MSHYPKVGNHPLIQAYNSLCAIKKETEDQLSAMEKKIIEAQTKEEIPRPIYKLTGIVPKRGHEDPDSVRFIVTLQNPEAFDSYMDRWGSGSRVSEKQFQSIDYRRASNGKLVSNCGGTLLFGRDTFVTEEEWQLLLSLQVPQRLKDESKYYIWA